MIKQIAVGLTCLLLATLVSTAGSELFSYIRAVPQGNDILLQWKSGNETGVIRYEVERKSEEVTDFRRVSGGVTARGSGSTYTFTDDGAFFKPQAGKKFTYRVKAVGTNFEQYSGFTTVVHEVSSVRRSWGMIKELFR
jgi:hypothetical protein